MEMIDLHYLIVTADAGKFAVAAKALGVDTSTVSRRVGNLEDELGLCLFERDHSGIRLTRAGRSILPCARRVLFHVDEVRRLMTPIWSRPTDRVRVLTVPCSTGSRSASNQGLRFIQPTLRQEGCGSGKMFGEWSLKSRTRSVSDLRLALGR